MLGSHFMNFFISFFNSFSTRLTVIYLRFILSPVSSRSELSVAMNSILNVHAVIQHVNHMKYINKTAQTV